MGDSCKETDIKSAWRHQYVYYSTWRHSCKQGEGNTLKMPQLVKSLFKLSMEIKKDSQSKDCTRGEGRGLQCSGLV